MPRLRYFAPKIAEVSIQAAYERYPVGLTGTKIRNRFYFELMRLPPHYPGEGNKPAPGFVQAGCEAAFPWQKKGTAHSEMPFTDEHREAYENSAMPEDVDVQKIMDLLIEFVQPAENN